MRNPFTSGVVSDVLFAGEIAAFFGMVAFGIVAALGIIAGIGLLVVFFWLLGYVWLPSLVVNHPALKDGACSGAIRCQPNPNGPVDQTKASKRR